VRYENQILQNEEKQGESKSINGHDGIPSVSVTLLFEEETTELHTGGLALPGRRSCYMTYRTKIGATESQVHDETGCSMDYAL
jgi:hypothetical protein